MTNRREALISALVLLSGSATAQPHNQAGSGGPVFKQDLPDVSLEGGEVSQWPGSTHLVSANASKTQPAKLAMILPKRIRPRSCLPNYDGLD